MFACPASQYSMVRLVDVGWSDHALPLPLPLPLLFSCYVDLCTGVFIVVRHLRTEERDVLERLPISETTPYYVLGAFSNLVVN